MTFGFWSNCKIMKQFNSEFIFGVADASKLPNYSYPEFAFIGRSNVGKSSLLNSILNRKNLARISSTPGKTQQINFYLIDKKIIFADLPGFGYASVARSEREKWLKLNMTYLKERENLKLVFQLIDSRHDPMETDLGLVEWLENNDKQFIIILTKTDKISSKLLLERKAQLEELTKFCKNSLEVLPYSSTTGLGRDQLLAIIKRFH